MTGAWARVAVLGAAVALAGCREERRLVEVFDNGPAGGPAGPSEGYLWVEKDALPPPGKGWKPTEYSSLSEEQRRRVR